MIKVESLNYKYNNKNTLEDINFHINSGEFVSIIGPNGAGKSTLLKCLCKLLDYKGKILVNNIDISKSSKRDLAKKIAYVQQEHSSVFDFSVEEVIEMGFYAKKDKKDMNIEEIMKVTETDILRNKSIFSLSGGEKQRVYIARALAQDATVLLLDEPIANLDMKHQRSLMKLCSNLAKEKNYTVVCVLHDINLASRYSDKILILKEGKIVSFDKTENIVEKNLLEEVYEVEVEVISHNKNKIILPNI